MKVLTADQMREADRLTIQGTGGSPGIPGAVLMENAGKAVDLHCSNANLLRSTASEW